MTRNNSETGYGLSSPLVQFQPRSIIANRAPTTGDVSYVVGTQWIFNDNVYICTGVAGGLATWVMSANALSDLDRLSADGGVTPVVPDANHNIDILGGTNITSVGGVSTLTLNLDDAIDVATSVTTPLYLFPAATDGEIRATAGQDILVTMGDAAGANSISFRSSTPAEVASLDSLGQYVGTNIECGTNIARINTYTSNDGIIQAFADDDTAAGASVRTAIYGNMQATAGDGGGTPYAVHGNLSTAAGSDVLAAIGSLGFLRQIDESRIRSTAAAVEGHIELLETDIGDAPSYLACGVKGYLTSNDGAAIPAGTCAGVASVVEYDVPFNNKAHGFVATRLDSGGGTGTAAQSAFAVAQGTVAIADWFYGLDLSGALEGFVSGDIRFCNLTSIISANTGATYSGDWNVRAITQTNTRIDSFNVNPILQSKANTGAAPSGGDTDENLMYLQDGVTAEQYMIGAQTIIAPRLGNAGLLTSLDLADAEGQEIHFGYTTRSKHTYTIGTSPAFFIEGTFTVADVSGLDPLWIGFRKVGAPNVDYTTYTDAAMIGLRFTTNDATVVIGTNLNDGGWVYTNTTDAFADGETHQFRVNVSAAGVVTFLIDNAVPTQTQAFTFDDTDQVMAVVQHHKFNAAAPGEIHLSQLSIGVQNWS
jgi:hypothetical protein